MANPPEGIPGVRLQRITESLVQVDDSPVVTLDTGNCEYIELTNKGPNKVYFTCDGGNPVAGDTGDSDVLPIEQPRFIPIAKISSVNFLCATAESANVYARLYT